MSFLPPVPFQAELEPSSFVSLHQAVHGLRRVLAIALLEVAEKFVWHGPSLPLLLQPAVLATVSSGVALLLLLFLVLLLVGVLLLQQVGLTRSPTVSFLLGVSVEVLPSLSPLPFVSGCLGLAAASASSGSAGWLAGSSSLTSNSVYFAGSGLAMTLAVALTLALAFALAFALALALALALAFALGLAEAWSCR